MNKKTLWSIVGAGAIVGFTIFGLTYITEQPQTQQEERAHIQNDEGHISLTIQGLQAYETVSISEHQILLDVLTELNAADRNLQLATKEYPGLGTLVESMAGKTNGSDNKYWQYKVNGVMPQVGADHYKLVDGDTVEWNFVTSEF
jgi:hypothetical protein